MKELKRRNLHVWIEVNELKWMKWHEWNDMNELPKVGRGPQFFFMILCEIELSLQSRAHFADLIFQKCSEPDNCFTIFFDQLLEYDVVDIWNRALATVSCTFCRAAKPRKQRPSFRRPRTATLPEKKRVSRPRVFSSLQRSQSLTLPNYLLMMWLTWWCGWHDDWDEDLVAVMVRQLAMTIVRNPEVS